MATDNEKSLKCKPKRSSDCYITRKTGCRDGKTSRRKALALLQFFELSIALIAMMIGVHAFAKYLPQGEVPIITGGLTLLIVAIEIYLEHGEPKIFNHWITISLDIGLVLLWAIWPLAGIGNPSFYSAPGVPGYVDHYVSYILVIVLSIIEVLLLISHIGVRAHQVRKEERGMKSFADVTQVQPATSASERMDLEDSAYGAPARQQRRLSRSQELVNTKCESAHPPGHRLREFSPEALYQLSLQMSEDGASGHYQESQQIAGSHSQTSLIAARKPTDPPRSVENRIEIEQSPPANKSMSEYSSTTTRPTTPNWPLDATCESIQSTQEPTASTRKGPVYTEYEVVPVPRIVVEPASPIAKPPSRPATPGYGHVDGADDVQTEVIRNGKHPLFDNGVHPLRMNPYKAKRDSPLRKVESVSDDWESDTRE